MDVLVRGAMADLRHPSLQWVGEIFTVQLKTNAIVRLKKTTFCSTAEVLDRHLMMRNFTIGDVLALAYIDIASPFSEYKRIRTPGTLS